MSLPQGKKAAAAAAAGLVAKVVQALPPKVRLEADREAGLVQAQPPGDLLVRRMGEAAGVSTAICWDKMVRRSHFSRYHRTPRRAPTLALGYQS